jgi:hypothetical protein
MVLPKEHNFLTTDLNDVGEMPDKKLKTMTIRTLK